MALTKKTQAAVAKWKDASNQLGDVLFGTEGSTWDAARRGYVEAMAMAFSTPQEVTISQTTLDEIPTTVVTPKHVDGERVLFYIHGGGYVSGSPAGYCGLAGHFAKALRAKVLMPDYRLAPQHPFPVPIEDTFRAYRSLLASGLDPQNIVVAGDSAGGAMVVTLMRWLRDARLPMPTAGVAISPWANLTHTGASVNDREGLDPLCSREALTLLARAFLGGALPTNPDVSPVFADVRGLAPILIQIGENEVMLSDAIRLASHLGENRVRVSLEVWPEMFHVWHLCAGLQPEADQAIRNAVVFLEQALGTA